MRETEKKKWFSVPYILLIVVGCENILSKWMIFVKTFLSSSSSTMGDFGINYVDPKLWALCVKLWPQMNVLCVCVCFFSFFSFSFFLFPFSLPLRILGSCHRWRKAYPPLSSYPSWVLNVKWENGGACSLLHPS